MGNIWKGCSDEKMIAAELALLLSAGIDREDIVQEDIKLDDVPRSNNYIHQITIKPKE